MPLLDLINRALDGVNYPATPEGLYEPIRYVLSIGGKRLRPTLLLLAYSLYRDDLERAMPAALAVETYHNHTLLHDDLMDDADMRRGQPTVHRRWDANTAILSGDTMLILALRHLLDCPAEIQPALFELFTRSAQEVCEGQQYDVNFEKRLDVTEAEYLEMIRLKTSVLLACAAKAGALLGGADEADQAVIYRFAERLGLAFQLQDDFLDVYGDPAVFGKKIGGDILAGKKTFLLISAYRRADHADRQRLTELLADHAMPAEEKIAAVTELYDRYDIPRLTREAIDAHFAESHDALDALSSSLPAERTAALWTFAEGLMGRKK